MTFPTPHLEKLNAALVNDKLPASDVEGIKATIQKYYKWISDLKGISGKPEEVVKKSVSLLNAYAKAVYLDLIFDSPNDFLYRQKGQLKLDNSIIEEFLPWLTRKEVIPELDMNVNIGPTKCYSAIYFDSTLPKQVAGAGLHTRTKDQDFAISRRLFIKASHTQDFKISADVDIFIAYIATEIKTNLDKTMFQEACATARDIKVAVPGAKYFLMAEWLDMTPVSTAPTDIAEVLLLRKARRLGSNQRQYFSESQKRVVMRKQYADYLDSNPFRTEVFQRWVDHIRGVLTDKDPSEGHVLEQGYF